MAAATEFNTGWVAPRGRLRPCVRSQARILASGEPLLINNEEEVWSQLAVSDEGCPVHECVYHQKGLCFQYRAMRQAEAVARSMKNEPPALDQLEVED